MIRMPFITETPNRYETDGGGNAEVKVGHIQCNDTAADCERYTGERHQTIAQRIKKAIEQRQNQQETDWNDNRQARLRLLQLLKFAGPDDPISGRQLNALGDTQLGFGDRTAEIA